MNLDIGLLTADLKRDEGLLLSIYLDTATPPNPSIGYGHKIAKTALQFYRNGIAQATAESLLVEDISIAIKLLDAELPWWGMMAANACRGLANMTFQLGIGGVLKFDRMVWCLRNADYAGAATEALDSEWARQCPERAQRIAALYRGCAVDTASLVA